MNSVVQCIDHAATEECDSAAGRWITHMNYLGLEDLADTISCSLQVGIVHLICYDNPTFVCLLSGPKRASDSLVGSRGV